MEKKFVLFMISLLVLGSAFVYFFSPEQNATSPSVKKFSSIEDFKSYLEEAPESSGYLTDGVGSPQVVRETASDAGGEADVKTSPDRVSETNVQERGIDEPDIVKTDGNTIFFSPKQWRSETKVIDALPAENVSLLNKINNSGQMLLKNDTLIVFNYEEIAGYNISDQEDPEEKWELEMNGSLAGARLKDGEIYLTIKEQINRHSPCPARPLVENGKAVDVACTDIYHPIDPAAVDITYHTFRIDPDGGGIEDSVSFVASDRNSLVYQSEDAIYVTSTKEKDQAEMMHEFLQEEGEGLFPERILDRVEKVMNYDLSRQAKQVEVNLIIEQYIASLGQEERRKLENELSNKREEYIKNHLRELETTTIVKISTEDGLEVEATGEVPGQPLNQFSMDEEDGKLRVATTVGNWDSSENDVYILDEELERMSSVQGLGETERIYAVRFMGDKGYVVTYRKVDPFYILDLSDPSSPTKEGELKIPGYSSYLHPLSNDTILGIGEEDGKVKLSVFDVSDVENPEEVDKYLLDEHWSDVSQTHRAFLMDRKHGIFFLPAREGGYVFSYEDGLELEKVVPTRNAKRAAYINDNLYVISEEEMVVLNEENWEKVGELEFEDYEPPVVREREDSKETVA
ncbi:MAG: beta-propeller domain-containing protein [Candidatus Aenigmatarchaeota archaeon]